MRRVAPIARRILVGMAMLAWVSQALGSESSTVITLTPPRAALAQEALWLKVTVGVLPRGALLRINREDGRPVGSVAPHGGTAALIPQDYTLALPKDIVADGTVRLRLQMRTSDGNLRAPTPKEVLGTELVYVPADR